MARFSDEIKQHLIQWALANGIPRDHLETRNGHLSWVLKREYQRRNLFDPEWWQFIEGKEHRWARALNSSQCFALNLFAPAALRPMLAKRLVEGALGERLPLDGMVSVDFEHTPPGAPKWLGERDHPTQVDVFFTATVAQISRGHLLVEVKLTESGFGSCRGPEGLNRLGKGNPHPERCQNGQSVCSRPHELCWLSFSEGRRYWEIVSSQRPEFAFSDLGADDACPFNGGLYQLLRNYSLGRALVEKTSARWAAFATCIHPKNQDVYRLKVPVSHHTSALTAFRHLAGAKACLTLDPQFVVEISELECPELLGWAKWMRSRDLLGETNLHENSDSSPCTEKSPQST
jgi:hypothetical protein